jgi:hypothetical protein
MTIYYPSDVRDLSDEQIVLLMAEIENSGILQYDRYDWDEDSWEYQASDRWSAFVRERDRRNPGNPNAGVFIDEFNRIVLEYVRPDTIKTIFDDNPLLVKLRKT